MLRVLSFAPHTFKSKCIYIYIHFCNCKNNHKFGISFCKQSVWYIYIYYTYFFFPRPAGTLDLPKTIGIFRHGMNFGDTFALRRVVEQHIHLGRPRPRAVWKPVSLNGGGFGLQTLGKSVCLSRIGWEKLEDMYIHVPSLKLT